MIAAGNIGCITQIAAGTAIPVVHTVELIDWATGGPAPEALSGTRGFRRGGRDRRDGDVRGTEKGQERVRLDGSVVESYQVPSRNDREVDHGEEG